MASKNLLRTVASRNTSGHNFGRCNVAHDSMTSMTPTSETCSRLVQASFLSVCCIWDALGGTQGLLEIGHSDGGKRTAVTMNKGLKRLGEANGPPFCPWLVIPAKPRNSSTGARTAEAVIPQDRRRTSRQNREAVE